MLTVQSLSAQTTQHRPAAPVRQVRTQERPAQPRADQPRTDQPLSRASQGEIQQAGYFDDNNLHVGHDEHYHYQHFSLTPVPDAHRVYHAPAAPQKSWRLRPTGKFSSLGDKWHRWNMFWYKQDQMFRSRMLHQSVVLFGNHDRNDGPQICDQCRHGLPHYLGRYDIPQYPRDEPAIISQPSDPMVSSVEAAVRRPAPATQPTQHRTAPRELDPDALYQARRTIPVAKKNDSVKTVQAAADTTRIQTTTVQKTVAVEKPAALKGPALTGHVLRAPEVEKRSSPRPAGIKTRLRQIEVEGDDEFVMPIIRANR